RLADVGQQRGRGDFLGQGAVEGVRPRRLGGSCHDRLPVEERADAPAVAVALAATVAAALAQQRVGGRDQRGAGPGRAVGAKRNQTAHGRSPAREGRGANRYSIAAARRRVIGAEKSLTVAWGMVSIIPHSCTRRSTSVEALHLLHGAVTQMGGTMRTS